MHSNILHRNSPPLVRFVTLLSLCKAKSELYTAFIKMVIGKKSNQNVLCREGIILDIPRVNIVLPDKSKGYILRLEPHT